MARKTDTPDTKMAGFLGHVIMASSFVCGGISVIAMLAGGGVNAAVCFVLSACLFSLGVIVFVLCEIAWLIYLQSPQVKMPSQMAVKSSEKAKTPEPIPSKVRV